ncbi:GNAT family N-acetyltransferase [Paenibacillus hemerocallicola]|uniref:GNAT family N-acetyltransferase n=1 Tax=Paenibacillus hemerocallicola TaxID=1172614 RepID=A0A5C4SYN7_9BACL|nr:GNAT family N-acetyltransferase [Paenibacillus hemerocallicola]TNJ61366.1 GNAT family N-acetyltransferase [Paenibacillus hemerocallicola]
MEFKQLDEARIAEMGALWNREWAEAYPIRERLLRQNVFGDRNLLKAGSWMAVDPTTDRLLGFIAAKAWQDGESGMSFPQDTGWIQMLIVDREARGQGIGGQLLARAESALRESGVRSVVLGNDFHRRLFPGIPAENPDSRRWLEKRGYAGSELTYDLLNEYGEADVVEMPRADGVTFRLARPDDREELLVFMKRCFPGRWEYQTRQYWELGGTGREFVVLERHGGEIIGFCRLNDAQSPLLAQNIYWAPLFAEELGGIGPLGIDERFRGQRYGLSIVQAAVAVLRERGIGRIVIDTTPYLDFYGKLGYRAWKSYWRLQREL